MKWIAGIICVIAGMYALAFEPMATLAVVAFLFLSWRIDQLETELDALRRRLGAHIMGSRR